MAEGLSDTCELAELWSEDHIQELPTFEHFHNIHQVKLEEALDAFSAKFYKNAENLPSEKMYWPSSMNNRATEVNNYLGKLKNSQKCRPSKFVLFISAKYSLFLTM